MASRTFTSAFKQHLAFFASPTTGLISGYSALKGSLALGLNFPVSCILGIGLPLLYGNTGFLRSQVDISALNVERTQLQSLGDPGSKAYSRAELLEQVKVEGQGWVDWLHVLQFWNLAADAQGRLSAEDLRLFQKGTLMWELEKRRRVRENAVPFSRGGPFSVAGHAWAVKKVFGVEVYQVKKD